MAFTPYATRPELKAWVSLNDVVDDVVMDECLNTATRWIDNYCDTHFWQDGTVGTPVARTYTPCDPGCRCLDIDDLASISTLKTDTTGDGTFDVTWSASDYQLQPVNNPTGEPFHRIEAVAARTFPARTAAGSRSNRVEVAGVWGWAAVPAPVHTACLIEASRELTRRRSPEGVIGFGDLAAIPVRPFDHDVVRLLADYRKTTRTTGVMVG